MLRQMSSPQQDKVFQINFEHEGRTVPILIRHEIPESPPIADKLDVDVEEVDSLQWFELGEANVRDDKSLTTFLASISPGSDHVYVWCYDAAWRKLLAIVG